MHSNNVWFTSDQHYGHKNILKYCNRPFMTAEDAIDVMVILHNRIIPKGGIVFHLGDFAFRDISKTVLSKLNGQHHLILGNHDREKTESKNPHWTSISRNKMISIDGQDIWLSHYPNREWPNFYDGAWHLFGHVHSRLSPYMKSCDIGVDSWFYRPVSFMQLKSFFDGLEMSNSPRVIDHEKEVWTSKGVMDSVERNRLFRDKLYDNP